MDKFVSKPVEIEAIRFMGAFSLDEMLEAWGEDFANNTKYSLLSNILDINTRDGLMSAQPGDWIIKGTIGEFYPCKDEVFRQRYEPAKPDKGLDPLRKLTLVVNFSRKSALDKVYANHLRGFHGALNDEGYHISAIAEGDQIRNPEDEDEEDDE